MKRHSARVMRQKGVALILLLFALVLGGAFALYRSANISFGSTQQDAKLTLTLARAKEALIAYAVVDKNRPGRMLCPDIVGEGNSDWSLSRTYCDTSSGWLPWKTLGLTDGTDDHGTKFWYAFSPVFSGTQGTPLNSDTLTSLRVDVAAGSPSNDVVAIIIATRGPLDTRNADGDEYYYSGTSKTPKDNDVIAVITRQELMAAVEKRVANEVKACLEQHATSAENTSRIYPWPAPLSNNIFKGAAKSLFGMIPATQPGGNPDEMLRKSVTDLNNAKSALESASTATDQLVAVQQITEIAAYARALFDRLYIVAADLVSKATVASSTFALVDGTISPVVKNGTTFIAGSAAIPAAITSALPALDTLRESLANSGFDTFLEELETQNSKLNSLIDSATASPTEKSLGALQTQANLFKRETLGTVYTPNPDLGNLLTIAFDSATTAVNDAKIAKAPPIDITLAEKSIASATKLSAANQALAQAIKASRLNIEPDEVTFMAGRANTALATFSANPTTETKGALLSSLESTNALVTAIATGSTMVVAARASALSTLQAAMTATKDGGNISLIQSASTATIANLNMLAKAMENNGDNILLETLKVAATQLQTGAQAPPATLTAGKDLLATVNDLKAWADITASYAEDIARKSRKGTSAVGDSDTSAYTAARQLLSSIDGSTGSSERLEAYIKAPTDTTKQTEAATALAKTQSLLGDTIVAANQLGALVESGTAQAAMPTVWYGSACAFLKPPTGSTSSWWAANNWANTTFYQISDRVRPATGRLTVNGSGAYRVVVISAGRVLTGQDMTRSTRTATHFLEGINADTNAPGPPGSLSNPGDRDGTAQNPPPAFSSAPVSPTFNDRLAY